MTTPTVDPVTGIVCECGECWCAEPDHRTARGVAWYPNADTGELGAVVTYPCGARMEPGGCQQMTAEQAPCGAFRCVDHMAAHLEVCESQPRSKSRPPVIPIPPEHAAAGRIAGTYWNANRDAWTTAAPEVPPERPRWWRRMWT